MGATVYRLYDANDALLYVGQSIHGVTRLAGHEKKPWWQEATRVTLEHLASREAALAREAELIQNEAPQYNIARSPSRSPKPKSRKQLRREKRERRREEKEWARTYEIRLQCSNCRDRHHCTLRKGTLVVAAECPKCGTRTMSVPDPIRLRTAALASSPEATA